MTWALIRKDARLLRHYLRSAVGCTLGCYLVAAVFAVWLTSYQAEQMQWWGVRCLLTLQNGSSTGMGVTFFFGALLSGSVFTLERADRSSEFLACLPPTRWTNLISKVTVLYGSTLVMLIVHVVGLYAVFWMRPHLPVVEPLLPTTENASPGPMLVAFLSSLCATMGGGLAVSAWTRSNGVPILCALLMPVLVLSYVSATIHFFGIEADREAMHWRFAMTASVSGAVLTFCGCYWYLSRRVP